MDRKVVCFSDSFNSKYSAMDELNGYCCNNDLIPIQIQVIQMYNGVKIFAIVEKIQK